MKSKTLLNYISFLNVLNLNTYKNWEKTNQENEELLWNINNDVLILIIYK
jgi:hypothetical protein